MKHSRVVNGHKQLCFRGFYTSLRGITLTKVTDFASAKLAHKHYLNVMREELYQILHKHRCVHHQQNVQPPAISRQENRL